MPYYYVGYDAVSLVIMVISLVITIFAQIKVKSAFNKYSKITARRGMTGRDAAQYILTRNGCSSVSLGHIAGNLTDHYDPRTNMIRLSDSTDNSNSIAAIGVAAHEAGHAVQYFENYGPIKLRAKLIPLCNIGSSFSWIILVLGVAMGFPALCYVGVALFSFAVLFQLITLPVELNASRRAMRVLADTGILTDEELKGARKVLTAAAMTYVAALATSILQLVRMLLIANRGKR